MSQTEDVRKPVIAPPGSGRVYDMGPIRAIFKADGEETAGRYSISEWWLEPRTRGPGVHFHPQDHIFYVIEGVLSLFVGEAWFEAAQGAHIVIPGGTPHDFENRSAARCGFISLNAPGGFEEQMPAITEALSATDLRM